MGGPWVRAQICEFRMSRLCFHMPVLGVCGGWGGRGVVCVPTAPSPVPASPLWVAHPFLGSRDAVARPPGGGVHQGSSLGVFKQTRTGHLSWGRSSRLRRSKIPGGPGPGDGGAKLGGLAASGCGQLSRQRCSEQSPAGTLGCRPGEGPCRSQEPTPSSSIPSFLTWGEPHPSGLSHPTLGPPPPFHLQAGRRLLEGQEH